MQEFEKKEILRMRTDNNIEELKKSIYIHYQIWKMYSDRNQSKNFH